MRKIFYIWLSWVDKVLGASAKGNLLNLSFIAKLTILSNGDLCQIVLFQFLSSSDLYLWIG